MTSEMGNPYESEIKIGYQLILLVLFTMASLEILGKKKN